MTPRVVRSRDELVQLIRDRRDELGLTMETLDALTGLPDRYCAKLLAPQPLKGMGTVSLKALLGALALGIAAVVVVEDPEQVARMSHRWTRRKRPDFTKRGQLSLGALLGEVGHCNLSASNEASCMKVDQIQVRLEPALRQKLQAEADRDRRPLSALIRNLLEDALAKPASDRQQEAAQ